MKNKLVIISGLTVLACVSYAWSASAHPTALQSGTGVPAEAQSSGRCEGHKAFDFDSRVGAVLEVSILPRAVNADGVPVRAISAVLLYQKATAYLGTANFHQLVPIGSDQTIDLSLRDLDLSIDQVEQNTTSEMRSYRATIKPRAGLTWDSVKNFKDDVTVEHAAL